MRASASLPLVSKKSKTAGVKLLDGGCTDSIPVKAFAKMGYNKDVVVLTRHKGYRKEKEGISLTKIVCRKYPEFVKAVYKRPDVYNHTLDERLKNGKKKERSLLSAQAFRCPSDAWRQTQRSLRKFMSWDGMMRLDRSQP